MEQRTPKPSKEQREAMRQARIDQRVRGLLGRRTDCQLLEALKGLSDEIDAGRATGEHEIVAEWIAKELETRRPELVPIINAWLSEVESTSVRRSSYAVYHAALEAADGNPGGPN